MNTQIQFSEFPKMARFSRECVITEKIDGTNAQIQIEQDGTFLTGSRNKWITPQDDNYGFSRWAHDHKDELIAGLGTGKHFGEWWGGGIQRKYGLKEKRFSLFNVSRWAGLDERPPECCHVVPILWSGGFDVAAESAKFQLHELATKGSVAAPGFMDPEGIVIWHVAGNFGLKKTLKGDEHKGLTKQ